MEKKLSPQIKTLRGREIAPYIDKIADLRITIFREYPYLYEGQGFDERSYLLMYPQSAQSLLVLVEDGDRVIGAALGLPLMESMEEIKSLFKAQEIHPEQFFYLGEVLLLESYRRQKMGLKMYQQLEQEVKKMGGYEKITFCEIVRSKNDLKKPFNHRSLDDFWRRQGYTKHPHLAVHFSWREIGEIEQTNHPMVFWIKDLFG